MTAARIAGRYVRIAKSAPGAPSSWRSAAVRSRKLLAELADVLREAVRGVSSAGRHSGQELSEGDDRCRVNCPVEQAALDLLAILVPLHRSGQGHYREGGLLHGDPGASCERDQENGDHHVRQVRDQLCLEEKLFTGYLSLAKEVYLVTERIS
eukprot:scaffold6832_cov210-Pinguiococcus_pyrenoidosus.AAC.1